jgi:hypothetical protein
VCDIFARRASNGGDDEEIERGEGDVYDEGQDGGGGRGRGEHRSRTRRDSRW